MKASKPIAPKPTQTPAIIESERKYTFPNGQELTFKDVTEVACDRADSNCHTVRHNSGKNVAWIHSGWVWIDTVVA